MTWNIEFLEEAEKDMKKLDHSVQIQVLKGIQKVSQNPLPAEEGGYGKPLGNKSGTKLTNLLKIKFRDLGIRVVYKTALNGRPPDVQRPLPYAVVSRVRILYVQKKNHIQDVILF
ncbi:MAG: type II toxin-antitoxin system RelE/ParE family toxin [Lachnospiraceae bacterium]